MSQERLRELLRERVADETMPDHSVGAWQAARVLRRRHRIAAASGVVAATVGVAGAIAVVESTPPPPHPAIDRSVPDTTSSDPAASSDTTYRGVPVWWSPDQTEESRLPGVRSPLPREIELQHDLNGMPGNVLDRAYAVFEQGRTMTLVGPHGALRFEPLRQLHDLADPHGNPAFPAPVLSPDGLRVQFDQDGGVAATYHVPEDTWTYDEPFDAGTTLLPEPGFSTEPAQQYGPAVAGAATWGMGVPIPVRDPGADLSDPEFLVAPAGVLAFTWSTAGSSRYKNCCPVAGWLDDDTVVYESRQDESLLVSWRVGSHDFGLVSRIHGSYDASSFALPG